MWGSGNICIDRNKKFGAKKCGEAPVYGALLFLGGSSYANNERIARQIYGAKRDNPNIGIKSFRKSYLVVSQYLLKGIYSFLFLANIKMSGRGKSKIHSKSTAL